MFRYVVDDEDDKRTNGSAASNGGKTTTSSLLQGKDRNDAFVSDFRSRVGGLGRQIDNIVRRVLDGPVIRPAEVDDDGNLLSYKDVRVKGAGANYDASDDVLSSLDDASRQLSMAP